MWWSVRFIVPSYALSVPTVATDSRSSLFGTNNAAFLVVFSPSHFLNASRSATSRSYVIRVRDQLLMLTRRPRTTATITMPATVTATRETIATSASWELMPRT